MEKVNLITVTFRWILVSGPNSQKTAKWEGHTSQQLTKKIINTLCLNGASEEL